MRDFKPPFTIILVLTTVLGVYCLGLYLGSQKIVKILSRTQIETLEAKAEAVSLALTGAGVHHVVACGAILGISRFGTLLPWDDDVDFFVHENQSQFLKTALVQFEHSETLYGFFIKGGVDIFILRPEGSRLRYAKKCGDRHTDYLLASEWVVGDFVNKTFGISGRPESLIKSLPDSSRLAYLKRTFGKNWETEAKTKKLHTAGVFETFFSPR